jgi:hypothetical protein
MRSFVLTAGYSAQSSSSGSLRPHAHLLAYGAFSS